MDKQTPAQKKLIAFIKKRNPALSEKEIQSTLNEVKRFVNLTRSIYTEPQARVTYFDRKNEKKNDKVRVFSTDLKELKKVAEPGDSFLELMRKVHKSFTPDKK